MSDTECSESMEVGVENYHDGKGNEVMRRPTLTTPSNCSSSSDVSSTVTTSSESDQEDDNSYDEDHDDTFELAKIAKQTLNLPKGLCENASIFREFFSLDTWKSLPIPVQNHLQQFLPRFTHLLPPQLDAVEQTRTLSMLFNGCLERFGQTPLSILQRDLERGNYRPDILKLRQSIAKSKRREQRFRQCEHISQLAKQLFLSRQRLIDVAYQSSPDTIIKVQQRTAAQPKSTQLYADNKLSAIRARKRFHGEISQMIEKLGFKNDELSADENEMDKLTAEELKDDALVRLTADELIEPSKATGNLDRCVYSTLFKREKEIDDEDACRQQQKTRQLRLCNKNFRHYLREHKRRKLTEPTLPEFETSDIRLRDVCARAQMGGNFKRIFNFSRTAGRKAKTQPNQENSNVNLINNKIIDDGPTCATSTPINNNNTNNSNISDNIPCNIVSHTLTNPPLGSGGMKLSEPPALVPIQPLKKVELYHNAIATDSIAAQKESLLDQMPLMGGSDSVTTSHINNNLTDILADDQSHFNMLDNEVELQQEEVETFASNICEETIPAFVMSNDETPTATPTPISTSTKFAHQARYNTNQMISVVNDISSIPLPKLEPISSSVSLKNHATQKVLVSPTRRTLTTTAIIHPSTNGNVNIGICANNNDNKNGNGDLIQETHSSYFSLIRDFFCCTPNYRMRYDELKSKIDTWLRNPITALNEWYTVADNWSLLLQSAVNFLIGDFPDLPEEYVPYIEYKSQINIYQWIGAGRDSDNRLTSLCQTWMEKRRQQQYEQTNSALNQPNQRKWDNLPLTMKSPLENEDSGSATTTYDCSINESNGNGNVSDAIGSVGGITPLPPRFPTTWKVKPATPNEIIEFQRQERERFEKPHRAYTYRMHGYESVVGPVKGIYTAMLAMTKARGHSMMVGDRPNFVTILTLVRDATARLPNGEGTRADISELLKCSQYINRDAAENVLQTIVSGALDRMHAEHDPCVRYDAKRKIWIYLHRNRSEEEFERLHQQNQCLGKVKKMLPRKSRALTNTKADVGTVGAGADSSSGGTEASTIETIATMATSSIKDHGNLLSTAPVTLPALVPSIPLITDANTMQTQQQQQKHQKSSQQQIELLMNSKSLPVPPLKYNIPSHVISSASTPSMQHQQQRKSLLKSSTIRQENLLNNSYSSSSNCTSKSGGLGTSIIAQNGPQIINKPYNFPISPPTKVTINNNSSNNSTSKSTGSTMPIIVATPQGLQTIHVANANNESVISSFPTASEIVTATTAGTMPTMAAATTTAAVATSAMLVTTALGGKRMATTFSKPIIINQYTQQQPQQQQHKVPAIVHSNCKTNVKAPISQQTQQIINVTSTKGGESNGTTVTVPQPLSCNAAILTASSSCSASSTTIILQTTASRPTTTIATQNNFLRVLSAPSSSPSLLNAGDSNAVKSITATTSASSLAVVSRPRILTAANLVTTSAMPSLILHNNNRLTIASTSTNNVVEQQSQQQQQKHSIIKTSPNMHIIKSNNNINHNSNNISTIKNAACNPNSNGSRVNAAATTASEVLKISAQAFANLQQKHQQQQHQQQLQQLQQQQRTPVKTSNAQTLTVTATKAPQRLILGNTTVLATPLTQSSQKNIILQHLPIVVARSTTATTTNVNVPATTTTTITKTTTLPTALAPTTAAAATSRIQTISATSLTPQQQRILIHNLKQQQQQQNNITTILTTPTTTTTILATPPATTTQTQYKTVQIVNANSYQQRQLHQQQLGKTLTLMVSQDNSLTTTTQSQPTNSNIARIIKTSQPQLKQINATTANATRMITNSGQIITLEGLLQRKGSALRVASGSTVPTATTTTTKMIATNVKNVQQQQLQQLQQEQQHDASTATSQKQQQTPQYGAISVAQPVTNNVINIGGTTLTLAQRILTTQANDNRSSLPADSISSTPSNTISPQTSNSATSIAIGRAFVATSNKGLTKTIATPMATSIGTIGGGSGNNIRLINAAGQTSHLNLANCLQGKQVIFAANNSNLQKQLTTSTFKNQTINSIVLQKQSQQQQSQTRQQKAQQQNANVIIGGHAIRLQQSNVFNKTIGAINVGSSSSTTSSMTKAITTTKLAAAATPTSNTSLAHATTTTPVVQTLLMGNQMLRVQRQMPQILSTAATTATVATVTTTTMTAAAIPTAATATNCNNNTLEMSTQKNTAVSGSVGTTTKAIFIGTTGQTLRLQQTNVNVSPTISTLNKNIVIQRNNQHNNALGSCKINTNVTRTASVTTTTTASTLPNRVVLAVQGGGQIFLSPTIQGSNVNLKNLQNLKLISLMNPNSQIKCVPTNAVATNAASTVTAAVVATTTSTTTTTINS